MLVGLSSPDDAGVYRLSKDLAIVQTVDFFTPIVDDAYAFGQIAAANALSDVYAMGGKPVTCLNIVGFPINKLPDQVLADILRGGADKAHEAGAVILGGHSIDDPEPKFGMAVTGIIHPERIAAKAGLRPGHQLVITKPIGIGVLTTATKRGLTTREEEDEAIRVMARLNDLTEVIQELDIRAATDVTGFGLLGHAHEMAREAGLALRIRTADVPVLAPAWKFARQGTWPGGMHKNRAWLTDMVEFDPSVEEMWRDMLCDPVTSGGLLMGVAPEVTPRLIDALKARGTLSAAVIGESRTGRPGSIQVI